MRSKATTFLVPVVLLVSACGVGQRDASDGSGDSTAGCFPADGRTVRWIVSTSPGGGQDVLSRLLEPFLERAIGAEIVVENIVGSGGTRGARTIRDAVPDGHTLGIVNGAGRLVAELSGDARGLHPLHDFTLLGRVAVEDPVWMIGPQSPFERVDDLWTRAEDDPIVIGLTGVGGSGFVFVSVAAELLGLDVRYLTGYPGGREYALGLIRGEYDVGGFSFESMRDRVEAGDMIPFLQISEGPVNDHPSLVGIPVLAGQGGVAARRAEARGAEAEDAVDQARALGQLFQFGRVVVAPPGLPAEVGRCLADGLAEAATDPALLEAASRAQRTISFAAREDFAAELAAWLEEGQWLLPILQRQLETARGG